MRIVNRERSEEIRKDGEGKGLQAGGSAMEQQEQRNITQDNPTTKNYLQNINNPKVENPYR